MSGNAAFVLVAMPSDFVGVGDRNVVLALGFAMELEVLDELAVNVASTAATGRRTLGGSYA